MEMTNEEDEAFEELPPPLVVDLVFETLKFLLLERQQIPKLFPCLASASKV